MLFFAVLQHHQQNMQNGPSMDPGESQISTKLVPKALQKIIKQYYTNACESELATKIPKIASPNGLRPMMLWGLVWYSFRSCSGVPLDPQNHDEITKIAEYVLYLWLSERSSHWKPSQLLSPWTLPAEPWEGEDRQYQQIAWAGCLGMRRCHAAGVFGYEDRWILSG